MNELRKHEWRRIRGSVDRMIAAEPYARSTPGGARWSENRTFGELYVYGTDPGDLRDWLRNLNGSRNRSPGFPGVVMTDGGADYAQDVIDHLPQTVRYRTVVGHSLGGDAASRIRAALGIGRAITIGAPRNVAGCGGPSEAARSIHGAPGGEMRTIDITHRCDPVCQLPPWNERLPWWVCRRVRIGPPWWQHGWLPILATLVAMAAAKWPTATMALGRWAWRLAIRPHGLAQYRNAIDRAIAKALH